MSVVYGGAATRDSVPVSGGGHYLGALGEEDEQLALSAESRWGLHTFAVLSVAVGGGLTGYLASGKREGAIVGALTHLALFGVTIALFGAQFSTGERVGYGVLSLGTGVGVGYLLYTRRKRRGS